MATTSGTNTRPLLTARARKVLRAKLVAAEPQGELYRRLAERLAS